MEDLFELKYFFFFLTTRHLTVIEERNIFRNQTLDFRLTNWILYYMGHASYLKKNLYHPEYLIMKMCVENFKDLINVSSITSCFTSDLLSHIITIELKTFYLYQWYIFWFIITEKAPVVYLLRWLCLKVLGTTWGMYLKIGMCNSMPTTY